MYLKTFYYLVCSFWLLNKLKREEVAATAATTEEIMLQQQRMQPLQQRRNNTIESHNTDAVLSSFLQRNFLTHDDDDAVDDDRHIKDPDDHNSTNGPAGIITRMPSIYPSFQPSPSPTITNAPSILHPCSNFNPFNFGITNQQLPSSMITFYYDVETDMDVAEFMGHSLLEQTMAVEVALLDSLAKIYFPQCHEYYDEEQQQQQQQQNDNIFQPSNVDTISSSSSSSSSSTKSKLIGMSSKPFDVAIGESCEEENDFITTLDNTISCYIIHGKLSLYYSPTTTHTRTNDQKSTIIRQSIQQIMNNGELNNCHPAIINVTFRNTTYTNDSIDSNTFDDEFENENETINPLEIMDTTSWIALGTSIFTVLLLLITRYKYYKNAKGELYESHHFEDTGSASTDNAYLELDLNHDEYMDQFDMVSSLTMTRSGGGTLSSSRSDEVSPGSSPNDMGHKSIIRSSPWSSMVSSITNGGGRRKGRRKGKRAIIRINDVPPVEESKEASSGESTSKSYIDSVQSETARLKAKIARTKKAIDELAIQHANLKQYVETDKDNTVSTSDSLRKARLALILLEDPDPTKKDLTLS